jgi:hypothetical protein
MPLRSKSANWFYQVLDQLTWTKLVETGRVGDIELEDFKERYRALADKHEAMICFMT